MTQELLICIVDDDVSVRESATELVRSAGMRVEAFASAAAFLERGAGDPPACLILDVNLPGLSGIELQQKLARSDVHYPIIFVTGHGDIPMSVRAIKAGAHDFFTKPFDPDDLLCAIQSAIARSGASRMAMSSRPNNDRPLDEIIGDSPALHQILHQVTTVAKTDSTVLIHGETGTGKELIARALHNLSANRNGPFVKVNCAAIPSGLLESELMGHEKGAFTGAIARRIGRFELAQDGTIFLDEIGELAIDLQPKLLRLLQERDFERVGGTRTLHSNARLITATNRDLREMVDARTFREDLYYRLSVFPLQMPPLRERREDIPALVRHFVGEFAGRMNKDIRSVDEDALERLTRYDWPGNIRELQNVLERAVILADSSTLDVPLHDWRARSVPASERGPRPVAERLHDVEREAMLEALSATDWVVAGPHGSAARVGLNRSTFNFRMKKLGIARERKL